MTATVELAAQLQALRDRGVSNPEQFAALPAERIAETVRWFDRQRGRAGTGVLVTELRNGGRRKQQANLADREAEYGRRVVAWLQRNFPELCDEHGPHPAAFTAVLRLHFRHGKGSLTRVEHGPAIEAAVAAFDQRHSLFDNNQTKE